MGRYTSKRMWQWRVNYMEIYFPSGNYVLIICLIFLPLFHTHNFRFKVFILILFYSFYNSIVHNARCEYFDGIILWWCQTKTSKYTSTTEVLDRQGFQASTQNYPWLYHEEMMVMLTMILSLLCKSNNNFIHVPIHPTIHILLNWYDLGSRGSVRMHELCTLINIS